MSNYDSLSCPVPHKLEAICCGNKDDGRFTDDENQLSGLAGLELLLGVNSLVGCGTKISPPNRTINGWIYGTASYKYKHKCGMYVYADVMTKENKTVYIIDEDEYPDCGPTTLSAFSDDKAALEAFKTDFGIKGKIKSDTYVKQTV